MRHLKQAALLILLFVVLTGSARAQFPARGRMVLFNGSLGMVKSDVTGHRLSGYMFTFHYEQIMINARTVWGVSAGYLNSQDEGENGDYRKINFRTLPFTFYAKHLFGSGSWRAYVKGGAGFHSSKMEYTGPDVLLADWDAGFLLNAGAGIYAGLDENIFLNVNYDFIWLDQSYYQDGMAHFINIGLGFHL